MAACMHMLGHLKAGMAISSNPGHLNDGLAEDWDACPRACMLPQCMLLKCNIAGRDAARGSSFRWLPDVIEPAPATNKSAPIGPKI